MAWSGRCPRRRRTATGTGPRPCTGAPTSTARPRSPRTTCRKPRSSPPTASRPPRRLRATDAERDSMAHATATVDVMRPPAPAERGVDVYNLKLGMWVFLASDPVKYGAATAGLYGSTFFTMTGFHGFHVTCGVISMTYVFIRALRGKYSQQDHRGIEVIGLYWHFVDLVWIILFTIVYLI